MAQAVHPDTGREVHLDPDELIITKTDPSGHITYANRVFMRLVGYSEAALHGKPHNIIRHPDMPRGVYRMMWKTLQQGREFFGVVKNFTASGDHYWVFAHVTPDYGIDRSLHGFYSVRRQAVRSAVECVEPVYAEMRRIEAAHGKADAPDASMHWLLEQMHARGTDYEGFVLALNQASMRREPSR